MGTSSHLIEVKKFMDKFLVCDIQVQEISFAASGLQVKTNKWLHLEDWLEIDAAIESLLNPYRLSESLDGFETDVLHLGRAIRVDCKKIIMSKAYRRILGTDKLYMPIALHIRVTKVNTKALMEQITSYEVKLRELRQISKDSLREEDKNLVHSENMREYDPTANNIGTEQVSNDYVPYRASVKTPNGPSAIDTSGSVMEENEPYSPKPVSGAESSPDQISESPNEIPTYRPARIAQSKHASVKDEIIENLEDQPMEEQPQSTKVLRRRRSPVQTDKSKNSSSPTHPHAHKRRPSRRPKATNAELFGSDDSDQEQLKSPARVAESPKRVATPMTTPSDQLQREIKRIKLQHKSSLDGWLSKGTIKKPDKTNGKSSKKSSRHPPTTDSKKEVSKKAPEEHIKHQNQVELQQIKELSALRDTIKAKRKSPPPIMEILSLTHLSSEDILGTFEGIKPTLDEIFKTHSKKTKITGFEGINHMKTLMLIDDKKQLQMMNFLRENYQPQEKGVPSLTDLYINALVPEWTVNVFMKEFHFTRSEAIERLHAQEECSAHHNNEGLDSSGML